MAGRLSLLQTGCNAGGQIRRIVVVRSLPGLGDLLCAIPALRTLRAAFPDAQITLLGLPGSQWLVDRFPQWLDDWLPFPGFPGIPEGWQGVQAIPPFLMQVQAHPFDLAIQLHGNGSIMNSFVQLLGAVTTAGFFLPGQFCPNAATFLPYPDTEPEIWRLLRLLEFLGMPLQGDQLTFPIRPADWSEYRPLAAHHSLQPGSYICLHAGASSADRRWSAAGFAQVADRLTDLGYRVVLTGTSSEQSIAQAVLDAARSPLLNLVGQTSLGSLAALLQQSSLLICNDTGISHLAAALQAPSIVIFSNSDPHRWAPLDRDRHRVICPQPSLQVTATTILAQATDLLGSAPPPIPAAPNTAEVAHARCS